MITVADIFRILRESGLDDVTKLPDASDVNQSIAKTSTLGDTNKKGGKSLDGIAAGTAKPYKDVNPPQESALDKEYPDLSTLVSQVRELPEGSSKSVGGAALRDLVKLMGSQKLTEREDGTLALPFSSKVALKSAGSAFSVVHVAVSA